MEVNLLLKLSYLSSNFTPTPGYLNPGSNNPAQVCKQVLVTYCWEGGLTLRWTSILSWGSSIVLSMLHAKETGITRLFIKHQRWENSPFTKLNSPANFCQPMTTFYSDVEPFSKYSPVMLHLSPATRILNETLISSALWALVFLHLFYTVLLYSCRLSAIIGQLIHQDPFKILATLQSYLATVILDIVADRS